MRPLARAAEVAADAAWHQADFQQATPHFLLGLRQVCFAARLPLSRRSALW